MRFAVLCPLSAADGLRRNVFVFIYFNIHTPPTVHDIVHCSDINSQVCSLTL